MKINENINKNTCHIWHAEQYHRHSSVQYQAAMELLALISLRANNKILDAGCGEGKISVQITLKVPRGCVIALDKSPDMIEFAQEHYISKLYPNLSFYVQDAQYLSYNKNFDYVFSCFALQWMPDKYSFFKSAYKALAEEGCLAITVPLNVSPVLELAITEITAIPKWIDYFYGFTPGWHMASEEEYKKIAEKTGFLLKHIKVKLLDISFQSRKHFEDYVLPWFTYTSCLPENLRESFFKSIVDRYLQMEPIGDNGEVYLRFHRLDLIATKNINNSVKSFYD